MTVDEIIAEAVRLPLRDAAYVIRRQKSIFDKVEGPHREPSDLSTPESREKAMREISALIRYERDHAQDGPTFERLKRAHPQADDAEAKQAIVAAVKFDRDCFRYFSYGRADDYWETVIRAVARAAVDGPTYLEITYCDARNWVAYHMK